MFDKFLRAFILIIPLWYYGGGEVLNEAHNIFFIGVTILFFVAMTQKPARSIQPLYPSLFFLYCATNFAYHKMQRMFMPAYMDLFLGALLFYLILNYSRDFSSILKTIKTLILINLIWIVLQRTNMDPIFNLTIASTQLHGFLERTSSMTALFIMALPFIPHLIIPLACLPNYSGITFGAVIIGGMIVSDMVLPVEKGAKIIIVAIMIIAGMAVLFTQQEGIQSKFDTRKDLLFNAIQVSLLGTKGIANPAFGYGLGSWKISSFTEEANWDIELKCEPAEWLFWTGILGLIFAGLWVKDIFRRIWEFRENPLVLKIGFSIIGIFLMSLTQGIFQNVKLMSVFLPLLAWLYIETEGGKCHVSKVCG